MLDSQVADDNKHHPNRRNHVVRHRLPDYAGQHELQTRKNGPILIVETFLVELEPLKQPVGCESVCCRVAVRPKQPKSPY